MSSPLPTIAVVGVHGHGWSHVEKALELEAAGRARLVAIADSRPLEGSEHEGVLGASVGQFTGLDELLGAVSPQLVVICTPIHTHAALAEYAMLSGADVLLEKPTTASMAEYERLCRVAEKTGRSCQIAFQSLGSHGIAAIRKRLERGDIGEVTAVGGSGCWVRTEDYWTRSAWSGRRGLNGTDVVDGVVTNPLAHAVATALALAGTTRTHDVANVTVDLYRANEIEADDTSVVRIDAVGALPITLGLTLCASERSDASVTVYGTRGRIVFYYTLDLVQLFVGDSTQPVTTQHARSGLLENLLEHRADADVPLLVDIEDTGAFMRVVEAVRSAPDPRHIDAAHIEWREDEAGRHPVVRDVEAWIERAGLEQKTFAELGAPWAAPV